MWMIFMSIFQNNSLDRSPHLPAIYDFGHQLQKPSRFNVQGELSWQYGEHY